MQLNLDFTAAPPPRKRKEAKLTSIGDDTDKKRPKTEEKQKRAAMPAAIASPRAQTANAAHSHAVSRAQRSTVAVVPSAIASASTSAKPWGTRKNPAPSVQQHHFARGTTEPTDARSEPLESTQSDHIFSQASTFSDLRLEPRLVRVLEGNDKEGGMGLHRPTRVQHRAVQLALKGQDVLVKSETGSGKTLAYLLPIVHSLQTAPRRAARADGTLALVLAPTRELCLQILAVLTPLVKPFIWLVPGMVTGGEQRKREKARLRKGITILIATPGRLLDHLQKTQAFRVDMLRWLVVDECDRLLDGGFEQQLLQIMGAIDKKQQRHDNVTPRQAMLLSATIDKRVQKLAGLSLRKPVLVDADAMADAEACTAVGAGTDASGDDTSVAGAVPDDTVQTYSTPMQLMEHYMVVPCKLRLPVLVAFLRSAINSKINCKIVTFVSSCDSVDYHYALLSHAGRADLLGRGRVAEVSRLHGNMPQSARRDAFHKFVSAKNGVLLCTDVAARGLDLPAVDWIIQFDAPQETRDYIHRVGRTARRGNEGRSVLFLMPSEQAYLKHLEKSGLKLYALAMEALLEGVAAETTSKDKKVTREQAVRMLPSRIQKHVETLVQDEKDKRLGVLATAAFKSAVRAYAAHSREHKKFFIVRSLHLGHLAKSFGLKSQPKLIGSKAPEKRKRQKDGERTGKAAALTFSSSKQTSEDKKSRSPGAPRSVSAAGEFDA